GPFSTTPRAGSCWTTARLPGTLTIPSPSVGLALQCSLGGIMATWGEFIAEFKVHNFKAQGVQGMFVKVDDVLDLFDERAKLRKELAQASYGAPPSAAPAAETAPADTAAEVAAAVAAERERCAHDVEEFAEACAAEPGQPEYVATVLRYAAELIRSRAQQ